MIYADDEDIKRCFKIINNELKKQNVVLNEELIKKITIDVMNISYSKGGDYSNDVIKSFAEVYIEDGLYKKLN
jgi:hypothetical protein